MLAKTTSIVSREIPRLLATARAFGLAGTLTTEVSTNSCLIYTSPYSVEEMALLSIGRKPTDTAFSIPASISFRISSMRSEVPFGAILRKPRKAPSLTCKLLHVPIGKSDR